MATADPWHKRLEQLFLTEADDFLPAFRQEAEGFRRVEVDAPQKLAELADRWKADPRPWARKQLLAYLDLPPNRGGHHAVVRRVFKYAEAQGDHDVVAACMTLFDRSVRRVRRRIYTPEGTREGLIVVKEGIPAKAWQHRDYKTRAVELRFKRQGTGKLYSAATREYLRRRAWRYFRKLGFQNPAAYVVAMGPALRRYRDADLPRGESLLDCWGLVHALFGKSPLLKSGGRHMGLSEGASLAKLAPAPYFPAVWKSPAGGDVLETLVFGAQASLVRRWAETMLTAEHAARMDRWGEAQWTRLLRHSDPQTQLFALEQLEKRPPQISAAAWFPLLAAAGPATEEALVRLARTQVDRAAASWDDLLSLACLPQVQVAGLGLEWLLQASAGPTPPLAERMKLARLAEARCPLQTGQIVTWALDQAMVWEVADADLYLAFFDARIAEVRGAALAWWSAHPAAGGSEWFVKLLESPYDDVRFHLVQRLESERKWAAEQADLVAQLWTSVLLNVARGGRQKPKVIQQIADVLANDPGRGDALLPALAAAARSIRGSESRAALSALVGAAEKHPSIADWVRRRMPELEWTPTDAQPLEQGAAS